MYSPSDYEPDGPEKPGKRGGVAPEQLEDGTVDELVKKWRKKKKEKEDGLKKLVRVSREIPLCVFFLEMAGGRHRSFLEATTI